MTSINTNISIAAHFSHVYTYIFVHFFPHFCHRRVVLFIFVCACVWSVCDRKLKPWTLNIHSIFNWKFGSWASLFNSTIQLKRKENQLDRSVCTMYVILYNFSLFFWYINTQTTTANYTKNKWNETILEIKEKKKKKRSNKIPSKINRTTKCRLNAVLSSVCLFIIKPKN